MAETHLYLTELVGLVVYDLKGKRIGKIREAALLPLVDPERVDRYMIGGGGGWTWMTFRHDQVASISLRGIHLREELLTPHHADEYALRLVRDLLDQQIIDAQGRKVVRVTDVTFEVGEGRELRVMEVDVGLRSVVRRLFQGLPPRWIRRMQRPIAVSSIPWKLTNILEPDPQRRLRLNITTKILEDMHPADLADIVEELSPDNREALIEALDSEVAADTLTEVEPEIQASILESLETGKAAEILEEMSAGAAADALAEMGEETSAEILEEMEAEPKTEVSELLEFDGDTAGGMMTTEFVAVPETGIVSSVLDALRESGDVPEGLNTVFLIGGDGNLAGSVSLARLFLSPPSAPLRGLAAEKTRSAGAGVRREEVMELFDKYSLLTLPVVDRNGVLVGAINADDVITVLRQG